MSSKVKVAAVQMNSGPDVGENLDLAGRLLGDAAAAGCVLAVLPENFPVIGARKEDKLECAEELGSGPIQDFLTQAASDNEIWIVSGSIPLASDVGDRCYGASLVIDASGEIRNCYRKIHLYDISVPDRDESYQESASLTPGKDLVVQDTPAGCLGLSICYDLRFPALYRLMARAGAQFLTAPSSFTKTTGEMHWHVLVRARAIENGAFVVAPAQSGHHECGRETYGHSLIVDPLGQVLADGGEGVGFVVADLDTELVGRTRASLPVLENDPPVGLGR